ncbi:MAG TPA: metallophosphoesterase, partial [Stellaceae bacterium]|nr:metallophosphoesterase [Stellaceae bacterium]
MAQSSSSSPANPPRALDAPVFAQPEPTEDPDIFKIKHPSDNAAYKLIDQLNAEHRLQPLPFPAPRGTPEPRLALLDVFGSNQDAINRIEQQQQITFHATGDCGSTRGPKTQNEVTDKMIADFSDSDPREVPQFCLLLGDIVYNFGEPQYYYDQFYDPYRNYHAPVMAAAGNHDGMISPLAHATSLDAYLRNFCADPANGFTVTPEAGGLSRTAQIQPGVFFTFEAPFVRVLVFYSNTLEDPGVIANDDIGDSQLQFLRTALQRVKDEGFAGALLFAHHHPPYAIGSQHSSSTEMRQQMDDVCEEVGVWPHAVLAGHAHNYQRFTRHHDEMEIPYIICGNGGHNVQKLHLKGATGGALRTPQIVHSAAGDADQVTLENYDDTDYGYLRITVDPHQLRIEYHPASDADQSKTPDDSVTIDLASRKRTTYTPNDMGFSRRAEEVRQLHNQQASGSAHVAHQGGGHQGGGHQGGGHQGG